MIEVLKNFGVGFILISIITIINHFNLGGTILSIIILVGLCIVSGWWIRSNIKSNIIKHKKNEDIG